MQVYSR